MHARISTFAIEAQKPWYRHLWPWLLMMGPLMVVLAGSYTAYLAVRQPDALVVDDYYKQGKAINQDLRRDRAAAQLGLSATLAYHPAAGILKGTIGSESGSQPRKVTVRLVHSTQPDKDLHISAEVQADGGFNAQLPMLEIAKWQVIVENEARDWRLTGVWHWPQQTEIRLDADELDTRGQGEAAGGRPYQ